MKKDGFSLIELLVAMSLLAILLTFSFPFYQKNLINTRLYSQSSNLVNMMSFARSESLRRNDYITVCPTINFINCSGKDFSKGTIIYLDTDRNGLNNVNQILKIATKWNTTDKGKMNNNQLITFNGSGNAIITDSILVCVPTYESYTITISSLGKLEITKNTGDNGC